jgi:hypothetical protein
MSGTAAGGDPETVGGEALRWEEARWLLNRLLLILLAAASGVLSLLLLLLLLGEDTTEGDSVPKSRLNTFIAGIDVDSRGLLC